MIKNLIRSITKYLIKLPIYFIEYYTKLFSSVHPSLSNMIYSFGIEIIDQRKSKIRICEDKFLILFTPNSVCKMRADTFYTKEPETLKWIDQFSLKGNYSKPILIDIGANVGIFSIYNSLKYGNKSLLFEPSPLNIKQLFKNININKVSNFCHVATLPLSNKISSNEFKVSTFEEGGALSGFGVDYGYDGNFFHASASMITGGITLDKYLKLFYNINDNETYIVKIDVDGIEHLILEGASETLKKRNCLSVLVEVNTNFLKQKELIEKYLFSYDFVLLTKEQSEISKKSNLFNTSYNYIYVKKST